MERLPVRSTPRKRALEAALAPRPSARAREAPRLRFRSGHGPSRDAWGSLIALRRDHRPRLRQHVGLEDLVEARLRQQIALEHQVVYALAGRERFLRDLRRIGITDVGIEGGDDADRILDRRAQSLAIRGDALHAAIGERDAAVAKMRDALEEAVRDDRLERVQLKLTGLGSKAHRDVVAEHLERDLVD